MALTREVNSENIVQTILPSYMTPYPQEKWVNSFRVFKEVLNLLSNIPYVFLVRLEWEVSKLNTVCLEGITVREGSVTSVL